ncbi:hypothetical protein ACIBBD_27605 [Streptomyces sp. NPDC051315]|uniref:hypothetical protein n=1 Tax=Streptomyces sp. NPDC051315 TaxID=3365650 RepID=UPI00378F8E78
MSRRHERASHGTPLAEYADAEPQMPVPLVDVAERIVVPVTALCDIDPEPCDDSFALKAL